MTHFYLYNNKTATINMDNSFVYSSNGSRTRLFSIINIDDQEINQPKELKLSLFKHQKKAIWKMIEIENTHKIVRKDINRELRTNFGIYSDKVGSGKTLVMATLLNVNKNPSPAYILPQQVTNHVMVSRIGDNRRNTYFNIKTTLIIVPHGLINQWENTLIKDVGLNIQKVNTKRMVSQLINDIKNYIKMESDASSSTQIEPIPIILISNTMFRHFNSECYEYYRVNSLKIKWNRIIIDEPHTFVLPGNSLKSDFCWFVCATPNDILYSNRQWLRYIMGGEYYYERMNPNELAVIKSENHVIEQSLRLPPYIENFIKCKAPTYLFDRRIRNNLPTEALARLHANDVMGAMEILNINAKSESSILDSLIENYKNRVHNEKLEITRLMQIRNINESDRRDRIQRHEGKVREFENKIKSITERVTISENCPICLDSVSDPRAITNCCHKSFCFECILMGLKASNNRCPMCKSNIHTNSLHIESAVHIDKKIKLDNNPKTPKLLSKTDTILKMIKNMDENSRYLIFSEYDNSFQRISYKLSEAMIPFKVLKGSVDEQQKNIKKYESGEIKILMLNANNFGAGLNLQKTTNIIIYHQFRTEDLKTQVIGRAQRIGRQTPLNVHYLEYEVQN
tara:strand:+ start:9630 stop:11507 length:1878 start_codon:yes stop_codon:yes gene_type:complete